ncbi:Hpt domain-containing protein [Bdellovibrionota bacterium FG-1]
MTIKIKVDPDLADLIPEYLENRKKDLLAFQRWADEHNCGEIRKLAHKIKGSAGGYGFEELTRLAGLMEEQAAQAQLELIRDSLSKMVVYLGAVEIEIEKC